MSERFVVIRDLYGLAQAIAENGVWVIHLNRGTVRNEENIDRIVSKLNEPTDLFSLLVAAFTAGEKLGQENANEIYWTSYPKQKVDEAAPEYAKKILSENRMPAGM